MWLMHGVEIYDLFLMSDRYEKCHTCHSHLVGLREEVWRLSKDSRPASKVIREQALLDIFSVLD